LKKKKLKTGVIHHIWL